MREGWHNDDYLVFFSDPESSEATREYEIQKYLPGYQIVGLRGWDDFIVRDASGGVFSVPTVPMDPQYLAAWTLPPDSALLEPDSRFTGKIKWYTKPIVFGGDPSDPSNTLWISLERLMQLVTWWNALYRDVGVDSSDA